MPIILLNIFTYQKCKSVTCTIRLKTYIHILIVFFLHIIDRISKLKSGLLHINTFNKENNYILNEKTNKKNGQVLVNSTIIFHLNQQSGFENWENS